MSIIARFADVASGRPDQIALITESSQMSFADLLRLTDRLDTALAEAGVRPGEVIVLATDRAEFTVAFTLLLSLRSLRVIFSPAEAVLDGGLDHDWVVTARPVMTLPPERQIILRPEWFAQLSSAPVPDYRGKGGGGVLVSRTSGSTGRSKFVWNTEDQRLVRIEKWLGYDEDGVGTNRRVAVSMSAGNVWALTGIVAALFRGGSVISLSSDRERLLGYIDLYRADTLLASPALVSQLARDPAAAQYLGALRDIRIGGGQAPRSVIERLARLCTARIHLTYGAAEVGAVFSHVYDRAAPQREAYLGLPVEPGLEVALYSETGEVLPLDASVGHLGIRVRDPSILRSYLTAGNRLEQVTRLGDVFFPGDIVRRDAQGWHYAGRTANVINAGGEKYPLDAIEMHLGNALNGQYAVALVETDPAWGEALVIVTEGRPLDPEEADRIVAQRFTNARVTRTDAVERFPMTSSGKVDREAVRRALAAPAPQADPATGM